MRRARLTALLSAAALAMTWIAVDVGPARAADPVIETADQAFADLVTVQDTTRSNALSGYVVHSSGSSEGGWANVESFDAVHATMLFEPSIGDSILNTSTMMYRSIVRTARTRAVLAVAGRPSAIWRAGAIASNPAYRISIGHEFDLISPADPVAPGASPTTVVESATLTTDADGTRHWVVTSHFWSSQHSTPSSDLLVTADPSGRLVATADATSLESISYAAPLVPVPTTPQYVLWSVYDLAEATYTLRARTAHAATSVVTAAARYAAAHHRPLVMADVRYEAPRVLAALPSSVVPVRWRTVTSGVTIYGWNRFARTWVIYGVRVAGHRASVIKLA